MFSEDTLYPGDKSNMTFREKAIRGLERQGFRNEVFDIKEKEMDQKLDEWTLVEGDIRKTGINIEIDDVDEHDFRPDERVRTSNLHADGQP